MSTKKAAMMNTLGKRPSATPPALQKAKARFAPEGDAAKPEPKPGKKNKSKGGRPVRVPGLQKHTVQFTADEWEYLGAVLDRATELGYRGSRNDVLRTSVYALSWLEDESVLCDAFEAASMEKAGLARVPRRPGKSNHKATEPAPTSGG